VIGPNHRLLVIVIVSNSSPLSLHALRLSRLPLIFLLLFSSMHALGLNTLGLAGLLGLHALGLLELRLLRLSLHLRNPLTLGCLTLGFRDAGPLGLFTLDLRL